MQLHKLAYIHVQTELQPVDASAQKLCFGAYKSGDSAFSFSKHTTSTVSFILF